MIESDELIYRRYLAERNEEDFRILLERHKESLMLFLCSFVHNMEDAEELMKLMPLLFFLVMFDPEDRTLIMLAVASGAGFPPLKTSAIS